MKKSQLPNTIKEYKRQVGFFWILVGYVKKQRSLFLQSNISFYLFPAKIMNLFLGPTSILIEEGVQEFVSMYLASKNDSGIVGLVGFEKKGELVVIDAAVRYDNTEDESKE